MNKQNKSYCRVPFDSVTVSPTGRMQLCCEAQWLGTEEKVSIKDLDNIDEWFNGEYLNSVRDSMLRGERIKECEFCYKNEELHGGSRRTVTNSRYFSSHTDFTEKSMKKIDIKFGNNCNLRCKMCFPYASSELWKEWDKLGWNTKDKDPNSDTSWKYYDGYFEEDYRWPKDQSNMEKIKQVVAHSTILHVTGGEPMINPEFIQLLKHCIDTGIAANIKLEMTTNATKIHPAFFGLAEQFKSVNVIVSMDGTGKTYEYVRYPANYNVVHSNVMRYNKFMKSLGDRGTLSFTAVLQLWNLHDMVEIFKVFGPLTVNGVMHTEVLEDPKFMRWTLLPEHMIKSAIKTLYNESQNDHPKAVAWPIFALMRKLYPYRSIARQDDDTMLDQLRQFTKQQDTLRGIKLADYIPGLVDLLR